MGPAFNGPEVVGSWWGYATADSTLVGILVVTIALLAVLYVVLRMTKQRGDNPRVGAPPDRKPSGR